jgi:hypothetical protein
MNIRVEIARGKKGVIARMHPRMRALRGSATVYFKEME